jgi:signal transduction histidine kinase
VRRLPLGSVRVRSTVAATLVVGLALAAGGWLLLGALDRSLGRRDDAAARGWARDLGSLAATGNLPAVVPPHGDDGVAQVVAGDGTVLAATPNVAGDPAIARFAPVGGRPTVRTVRGVPDGPEREDYRVWAVAAPSGSGPVTVYVATSAESVSETVRTQRRLLVRGLPVALLVVAAATWAAVGRGLRPVEQVRARVAAITEADLSRRVPVPPGRDEISQLAETMNVMLARIETAATRQRRFVADASHELQSPLAGVRTELEVALARPAASDWVAVATDLLARTGDMESLVRDLLFLAREDESAAEAPDGRVDLDDVVLEEVARLRPTTRVPVDATLVSAAPVRGSRGQLARLVRNLLENAVRHATSRVDVRLRADDHEVQLVVADDGPGVPAGDRDRVFDRFVRLDSARRSGGTGLGLAIVAAIAARHGGSVTVDGDGGAAFVVRLPAG